ncbi:MAG: F-type H+-transporting ATPase subunit gamma [Sphingobacteriales bacterium]|jgi:F-type H+-transporting ATPase subunit gamma
MANLKEVRTRITSVISTQQITKAMKMVSAAKLRRAQNKIIELRPYANKLKGILSNLTASMEGEVASVFAEEREVKNVLLVPITSNRGLCGGFNANIVKATNLLVKGEFSGFSKSGNLHFVCVGKKGQDNYTKLGYNVIGNNNEVFNNLSFDISTEITQQIIDGYVEGKWDKVVIVYNEFKNAAVQIVRTEQMLPISKPEVDESAAPNRVEYLLEPSKEEIIKDAIPEMLKIQLYKGMIDSNAAEHGARMTAMDNATENANELLKNLRLSYNRARQAAITTELSEIVAGANAL